MKMKVFHKISRKQITETPFYGILFSPNNQDKFPGVIVIPGSDGGVPETIAEYIASRGYSVLALGYFGLEGLPKYLENIPLEYFVKAIEYFKDIISSSVTLMGYSRGGSLVLLLGSLFPQLMDGIIAYVPSSVVFGGFPHPNQPAWLLNNQPIVPFLNGLTSQEKSLTEAEDLFLACEKEKIPYHKNTAEDPYEIVDLFVARQNRHEIMAAAAIPVENIICPLLLIAGGQDKIWPSSLYVKLITDRLKQKGSNINYKTLVYPNAGHGIIAPYEGAIYHPVGKFWCTLGGTPEGNQQANKNAWEETFKFLKLLKSNC